MASPALHGQTVNLALARPYELAPPPDYSLCTDSGDAVQLTDGLTADCDWRAKSTVGWANPKARPTVTVDLGTIAAIEEIRIHTIGGGRSGVLLPSLIWAQVSFDGTHFSPLDSASSLGIEQDRMRGQRAPKQPRVMSMRPTEGVGRFLRLFFERDGSFLFVDEIEVVGRKSAVSTPQSAPAHPPDLERQSTIARMREHLRLGLQQWAAQLGSASGGDWMRKLSDFQSLVSRTGFGSMDDWLRLQSELGRLRGQWLGESARQPWSWSVANPMVQIQPWQGGLGTGDRGAKLTMECLRGERECASLNLTNCGVDPLRFRADVSAFRMTDGSALAPDRLWTIRYSVAVDARSVGIIHDALPRLSDAGFTIDPGEMAQLWLELDSTLLPPGTHDFAVRIFGEREDHWESAKATLIPGKVTVHSLAFPEALSARSCTWAYVDQARALGHVRPAAAADLAHHHTNVVVIHPDSIPKPSNDRARADDLDFSALDAELERYSSATTYLLFWGMGKHSKGVPGLGEPGSEMWKSRTRTWLGHLVSHLKERGVGYERFVMYPYDEFIGEGYFQLARFIKEEVDGGIRLYANSRGQGGGKDWTMIAPYIDVWCLPDADVDPTAVVGHRGGRPGAEWWSYLAEGPGKANPPYAYYRLLPWRSFARGETGCGFWVYVDPKASAVDVWNDWSSPVGYFAVVYPGEGSPMAADEAIIPSRRWEAWREGLEDFEYLAMLRRAISEARRMGRPSNLIKAGEQALEQSIRRVLADPNDAEQVYLARQELIAALSALAKGDAAAQPLGGE